MASSSSSSEAAASGLALGPPLLSPSVPLAQPRFDTAMPKTDGRAGGMCACKSPISFAHFLHFKIRSAKEGEREGE